MLILLPEVTTFLYKDSYKNTLNSKVNSLATEIEQYQTTCEYIKGIKDILAGTMSQLVELDPNVYQDPEPEGQTHGHCIMEQLSIVSIVQNMLLKAKIDVNNISSFPADSVVDATW